MVNKYEIDANFWKKAKETAGDMIMSSRLYSAQEYLELVTDSWYEECTGSIDWIQGCLCGNDLNLWDYPLSETDFISEDNTLPVVLVDCSHYEGDVYVTEYRWFEVPDEIEIDEEEI